MAARAKDAATNVTAPTDDKQNMPWRFQPGQSGNPAGRTKGARNKLDDLFLQALYKDFKDGGVAAISACRLEKPDVYLNVIAKVLPKQIDVKGDESVANLADGLQAVAAFLGSFTAEAGGSDHAGSMSDGPILSLGARPQTH